MSSVPSSVLYPAPILQRRLERKQDEDKKAESDEPKETMLAQLVQKVASFRRQLVAEKAINKQQESTIEQLNERIKDLESLVREKERLQYEAIQAKTQLEQKMHFVNVEPVPAQLREFSQKEMDRLLHRVDGDARQRISEELRRLREELVSVQWHYRKLEEKYCSDKMESEQLRLQSMAEIDTLKREQERGQRDMLKYRSKVEELLAELKESQEEISSVRGQLEQSQTEKNLAEQEIVKFKQALHSKSLEFDRLVNEYGELKGFCSKLALRLFEYKTRVETMELPIRRFNVMLVSASMPLAPAQICIKKLPATGELLLVVSDGVEDHYQDICSLQDIFNDPRGAQHRFVIVFSHKKRMVFETPDRDECVKCIRDFIRLAATKGADAAEPPPPPNGLGNFFGN